MDPTPPEAPPPKRRGGPRPNSGGARLGAGRKPFKADLDGMEKLAAIGGTEEEIAAVFGCGETTLRRPDIKEAINRGRATGRVTLRRLQWQGAQAGNPTMLIWLGKQLLGQRDRFDTAITDASGPLVIRGGLTPLPPAQE